VRHLPQSVPAAHRALMSSTVASGPARKIASSICKRVNDPGRYRCTRAASIRKLRNRRPPDVHPPALAVPANPLRYDAQPAKENDLIHPSRTRQRQWATCSASFWNARPSSPASCLIRILTPCASCCSAKKLIGLPRTAGGPGRPSSRITVRTAAPVLFLGRNEEQGPEDCVYHGWKFDRRRQTCVDMPNETR